MKNFTVEIDFKINRRKVLKIFKIVTSWALVISWAFLPISEVLIFKIGDRKVALFPEVRIAKAETKTIILNFNQTILTESGTWTVPDDWTDGNNTIEVIGAGGAGYSDTANSAGAAGGGGGGYAKSVNVDLTPGATLSYIIGQGGKIGAVNGGDTYFCNSTSNCASIAGTAVVAGAKGGTGGTSATANGVGGASASAVYSGTGSVAYSGGNGGDGAGGGDSGGGGGGAAGPNGAGATGGNGNGSSTSYGHGGGGGGSNGGSVGGTVTGSPPSPNSSGAGGNNRLGSGGGAAVTSGDGTSGSNGGGGAGGFDANDGGNGGDGTEWTAVGAGGGGGGGGDFTTSTGGGNGGLYGAGGGGGAIGGRGAPGVIVITYNSKTPTNSVWKVPADWNDSNNTIEVIGGGGSSYSAVNSAGAGAGGGGGYARSVNVDLTPGADVLYSIGKGGRKSGRGSAIAGVTGGDSYLCNSTSNCASITDTAVVVGAKGGTGSVSATTGAGGGQASMAKYYGTGSIARNGGTGGNGNGTGDNGGGGGGAGGFAQVGQNGGAGGATSGYGGGGGGGAGDDSGADSSPGEIAPGATGGPGGLGRLGTEDAPGTGAGGDGGNNISNGVDGYTGNEWGIAGGGGGGGGAGDNTGAETRGGDGALFGGGGGGGKQNGFGGNGIIVIKYEPLVLTPPSAPTGVSATDGTYTDKVTVTWTKSSGATGYKIYEGSNLLDTVGDVATYDDTSAPAPTITPGTASASDGTSPDHVVLSLSGESVSNGTSRTYKVVAFNAGGDSPDSSTNTGYRGVGSLTYQWQRSAADSDASYSNISGATTDPYNDTGAPVDGSGRYYKAVLSATGATNQTSTANRGYRYVHIATISGTAYQAEGGSALTSKTIKAYVNGALLGTDTSDASTGAWEIAGSFDSGDIITVLVDGDTINANTIFISDGTDKTDVNIYGGALVVRHDTGTEITNANLHTAAIYNEDDMVYATSTSNAITLNSNIDFHLYTGDTYTAGGALTTQGTGSLYVDDNSDVSLNVGTNVISGDVTVDSGATLSFSALTEIGGDFTLNSGATHTNTATTTFKGGTTQTITDNTSGQDFGKTQVSIGASNTTLNLGSNIKVTSIKVDSSQTLNLNGSHNLTLSGSATPFVMNGTFVPSTGTVIYESSSNTNITPTNYHNLNLTPTSGTPTFTLLGPQTGSESLETSSTSPQQTGTGTEGLCTWVNHSYVTSSDNLRAVCEIFIEAVWTDYNASLFRASDFGFSIPSEAAIEGVEAYIEHYTTGSGATGNASMVLRYNESFIGNNMAGVSWPASEATSTYGGPTNTWGANLTPEIVNSSSFELSFVAQTMSPASTGYTQSLYIDAIAMKVYYSVGDGETVSQLSTANNFNIGGGGGMVTVDANTNDIDIEVDGNFTVNTGNTFSASDSGVLSIGNNFTNNGTFTHNNGTVAFINPTVSTISSNANMSFYNLDATSPGKTLKFQKHTSDVPIFTIANQMNISGQNIGNPIFIESDTVGSQWQVYFSTPQTNIHFADVKDSACAIGSQGVQYNATNSGRGNNGDCWNITNRGAEGSGVINSIEQSTGGGILRTGGGNSASDATEDGSGGGDVEEGGDEGGGGGAVLGASTINLSNLFEILEELKQLLNQIKKIN